MKKHDDPVCYLSLPSTRPDVVIKVLEADAYRALADHLTPRAGETASQSTVLAIRNCLEMCELLMEAARFDAGEAAKAKTS